METFDEVIRAALEAARQREGYIGPLEDFTIALASRDWQERDPVIEGILTDIRAGSQEPLTLWHAQHHGVEDTILQKWNEPLRLLDLLIVLAGQFGTDFYRERIATVEDGGERLLLTVLTELHARACQISSAIHLLLRSGYADDAHARWRTLHEISVIANFVKDGGASLAERYQEHGTIQRCKELRAFRERSQLFGNEPEWTVADHWFEERYELLIQKYGSSFKEDYGWAADALGKKKPTFRDIENNVKIADTVPMALMRAQYRMASANVHASAHGTQFRLGLGKHSSTGILFGPSIQGLGDPGFATANALCETALTLLQTRSNEDDVVRISILTNLTETTSNVFLTTPDDD